MTDFTEILQQEVWHTNIMPAEMGEFGESTFPDALPGPGNANLA